MRRNILILGTWLIQGRITQAHAGQLTGGVSLFRPTKWSSYGKDECLLRISITVNGSRPFRYDDPKESKRFSWRLVSDMMFIQIHNDSPFPVALRYANPILWIIIQLLPKMVKQIIIQDMRSSWYGNKSELVLTGTGSKICSWYRYSTRSSISFTAFPV